ncbi:VWA domain-containing protein [Alloscardovia omnicolens]|uniref:vWA domain-containing protein n=1 Tax=Alloscardovia omnicolens TaxID=419015 RepID=UPI003A608D27
MSFIPVFGVLFSSLIMLCLIVVMGWLTFSYVKARPNIDTTVPMMIRRWILVIVACIMIAGPSSVDRTTTRAINATNVFIAVDVTGSMAVQDAQYGSEKTITRIRAARNAVHSITSSYPDAQFSTLSFGSHAAVNLPLTPDVHAVETWADSLTTEPTQVSSGSTLDKPLNALTTALKAAQDAHPDDTIVLYIISDGEQTSGESVKSFSVLRKYVKKAVVVGVGSEDGGKIPQTKTGINAMTTPQTDSWVQDPDTKTDGISQLNPSNLSTIADQLSGTYVHTEADRAFISQLKTESSQQYRLTVTTRTSTRSVSFIWPWAIIFTIVSMWELVAWWIESRKLVRL